MKKVIVVLNVNTDKVSPEGLFEGIDNAFDRDLLRIDNVDSIHITPFNEDDPFNIMAAALAREVGYCFEGDELPAPTEEEVVAIANWIDDSETFSQWIYECYEDAKEELKEPVEEEE